MVNEAILLLVNLGFIGVLGSIVYGAKKTIVFEKTLLLLLGFVAVSLIYICFLINVVMATDGEFLFIFMLISGGGLLSLREFSRK